MTRRTEIMLKILELNKETNSTEELMNRILESGILYSGKAKGRSLYLSPRTRVRNARGAAYAWMTFLSLV